MIRACYLSRSFDLVSYIGYNGFHVLPFSLFLVNYLSYEWSCHVNVNIFISALPLRCYKETLQGIMNGFKDNES